jgi:penicillin-binding protein 2
MPPLYTLKSRQGEQKVRKIFIHRLIFIHIFVLVLMLVLVGRLFYLQGFEYKKYTTLSDKNQVNTIPIEPTRGVIYDRNGVILAENVPIYSLEIIPDKITSVTNTITALTKLIPSITPEDIQAFYKLKKQRHSFDSVPLKLSLTAEEVAIFSVNQYCFTGVSVQAHLIRHYPHGKDMAHVLGYVGRINQEEWSRIDKINYSATNFIGKIGIEKHYEDILHGTVGYEQVETNANGRVVRTLSRVHPIPGQDLHLSIDLRLQKAAEEALGKNIGIVIAIDPNNGEVLAMVSKPSYNPNLFVQGINQKDFSKLMKNPKQPLYNRAIRGQYPLASTVKPYLGLAALDQHVVTPDYKVFDPGWFRLPNSTHRYRDWRKGGHGWVNVSRAIMVSCDVYFYTVGYLLGIQRISTFLKRFGYGEKTGIDMNEELPGLIPTPEWKRRVKGVSWYPGDTVSSSIGQGYMLTTPLQLAHAVAGMSQKGIRYQPHLLREYKVPGEKWKKTTPNALPPVVLNDSKSWDVVIDAMQMVIKGAQGTGVAFRNAPYSIAGKTGTAQVFTVKQTEDTHNDHLPYYLRDHSLFIAFAPVDHPQIVLAVVVEHSHDAAKVARQVMDAYLLQFSTVPYNLPP